MGFLGRVMGFEPTAFCATNRRSNQLSYTRLVNFAINSLIVKLVRTEVIIPCLPILFKSEQLNQLLGGQRAVAYFVLFVKRHFRHRPRLSFWYEYKIKAKAVFATWRHHPA